MQNVCTANARHRAFLFNSCDSFECNNQIKIHAEKEREREERSGQQKRQLYLACVFNKMWQISAMKKMCNKIMATDVSFYSILPPPTPSTKNSTIQQPLLYITTVNVNTLKNLKKNRFFSFFLGFSFLHVIFMLNNAQLIWKLSINYIFNLPFMLAPIFIFFLSYFRVFI